MEPVQHHFLINPAAGKGKAPNLIPAITTYMAKQGLPFLIHTTSAPGDAEQYVRTACKKGQPVRFYVCGGDGTLNEAINGAAHQPHAAVGVIPFGNGNDFVRNFDKPALFHDLQAQTDGGEAVFDLLSVNGRYALNMVNIGFDCEVVLQVDRFRRYPLIRGPFAYLLAVFVVLSRKMGQPLRIRLPDGTALFGSYLLCTAANGRFYGSGFCAAPESCINDGLFELTLVQKIGRLCFLSMLPSYKKGTYFEKKQIQNKLTHHRLSSFILHTDLPAGICIDGEITFFTSAAFALERETVRFIIPRGCEPLSGFIRPL